MSGFNELIGGGKPTLVDFYATWCGPCRMQAPILEQVKLKVGDKANIVKIDVDKEQEVAVRYKVQSIPTIILFKDGEVVWRAVGVQQEDVLVSKISEYL